MNTESYFNPDYLEGRPTGTCCHVCAKREGCPFESGGRKCLLDHTSCNRCTHWDMRGCILFQFDKKFLKMGVASGKPVNREKMTKPLIAAVKTNALNRKIVLGIILAGILMAVLDAFMMNIALPTVTSYFLVGIAQAQWTVTGYLVATTSLFIFFGKVSEYTGKARLFSIGLAIFTASSLFCGFSPGISWLIAFRILQGLGASMMFSISGAIIVHTFPAEEMGRAMGLFGAVFGFGAVLGPVLGGMLTDLFGWQSIFLVNVPIGILLFAGALRYFKVPETRSGDFTMDWAGAGLLFLSITSLILFCGQMVYLSVSFPVVFTGMIAVAGIVLFIVRQSRCRYPLLDLSLIRNRWFVMPVVSSLLFTIAVNLVNTIGPFYFEGVLRYSPLEVGIVYMLVPLFLMFSSPLSGWVYDRYHYRYSAAVGAYISVAAFILLVYAVLTLDLTMIILAFVIRGVGGGFFVSPNATEVMTSLPKQKTAVSSSVSATMNNLASALGVSFGSIIMALEFSSAGYTGTVLNADPSLLSRIFAISALFAICLSLLAGFVSVLRNRQRLDAPAIHQTNCGIKASVLAELASEEDQP